MAEIRNYGMLRHLRSEASVHITYHRKGRVVTSGRGLAFWFRPDGASIAEAPMDDREMPFLIQGRSHDYQPVTLQGTATWRVKDAATLGRRIDFSIDLKTGHYQQEPVEQITNLLVGLAQQQATQYCAENTVDALLAAGLEPLKERLEAGLIAAPELTEMGLEVVTLRLLELAPSAELDRALQTPTFEALQQKADQATFERRAMAVEKERAIAENELQNQIELARRETSLIEREGENSRNRAQDSAAAKQIEADGEAGRIRAVEQARADMEEARMAVYKDLRPEVLAGLAARDFAKKLQKIEHLNVTPDLLGHLLANFTQAGTKLLNQQTSE